MKKKANGTALLMALLLATVQTTANAEGEGKEDQQRGTEWAVIDMGWKGSQPKVCAGNLKIRLTGDTKVSEEKERSLYSFIQEAVLEKNPKMVHVSGCSIVGLLDTYGGGAGALHKKDNMKNIALYMSVSESHLVTPRICVSVIY